MKSRALILGIVAGISFGAGVIVGRQFLSKQAEAKLIAPAVTSSLSDLARSLLLI